MCFVSNVFPEAMETKVVQVQLDRTLQFQSIPPLLPAYNKYMGGVDCLNQVRKTYGFNRSDTGYVFFSVFFNFPLDNAYLLYKQLQATIASCLICPQRAVIFS